MKTLAWTLRFTLMACCLSLWMGCSDDNDPEPLPPVTSDAAVTDDVTDIPDAPPVEEDTTPDPVDVAQPDPETSDTTPVEDVTPEEDVTTVEDGDDGGPEPPEDTAPTCVDEGGQCWTGSECCEGFCSYSGMDYAPGNCEQPKANGSFCLDDAWCESGICADQMCQEVDCMAKLDPCWSTSECCGDLHCSYAFAYVEGTCDPPLADGSPCQVDDWCESGNCIDGYCNTEGCVTIPEPCAMDEECCSGICDHGACSGPLANGQPCDADSDCISANCKGGMCDDASCMEPGGQCFGDAECCDDFCTYDGMSYMPGVCALKKGNGAFCNGDGWCQSGACVDSTCVEMGCIAMGEPCYGASECCSSMCTWTGDAVLPGVCGEKQANGETCVASAWCQSGYCEEGTCAPFPADEVTFADVWDMVLVPMGCTNSSCHGAPSSFLMFGNMDNAYLALTTGSSLNPVCGATGLVVSGDPDASSLWVRVRPMELDMEMGGPCMPKMPLGSEGLSLSEAQIIYDWIAAGANP